MVALEKQVREAGGRGVMALVLPLPPSHLLL